MYYDEAMKKNSISTLRITLPVVLHHSTCWYIFTIYPLNTYSAITLFYIYLSVNNLNWPQLKEDCKQIFLITQQITNTNMY